MHLTDRRHRHAQTPRKARSRCPSVLRPRWRPPSMSWSVEGRALPIARAPRIRASVSTAGSTPAARAHPRASSIIARRMSTSAGSSSTLSVRRPVIAHTGLKDRLPSSLDQMSCRMFSLSRHSKPAPFHASASRSSLGSDRHPARRPRACGSRCAPRTPGSDTSPAT
jgi:hypothetical protein